MSLNRAFVPGLTVASADDWNGLQAPWEDYTPDWTASAGTPAVGNGTLTGKFLRIGKTVLFRIELVVGSTTTFGTTGAAWRFTLPLTPTTSRRHRHLGSAYDNGTADYTVYGRYVSGGPYLEMVCQPSSAGGSDRLVTDTVPFTWGVADELCVAGTYEAV